MIFKGLKYAEFYISQVHGLPVDISGLDDYQPILNHVRQKIAANYSWHLKAFIFLEVGRHMFNNHSVV